MRQGTADAVGVPEVASVRAVEREAVGFPEVSGRDVLTGLLRDGAQRMLAQAIEAEVAAYLEKHAACLDSRGHRLVVRNGYKGKRRIQTGLGPVTVRQPRIHDRRIVGRRRVEVHNVGRRAAPRRRSSVEAEAPVESVMARVVPIMSV
ncbi:MAG: hypothetical protein FLDDKLPJ_03606 [Phycisphaerae bacterium]|nr:hypothetical protein [Phycisphaerae bacterium]